MNRRIIKEVADFKKMADEQTSRGLPLEYHAELVGEDLSKLRGFIMGPKDSVYEGFKYNISITLTPQYPIHPPIIMFTSRIYHPNVGWSEEKSSKMNGEICLDILKDKWTPALNIRTAILSIQAIMSEPNPDSALNGHAANLYTGNRALLREIVCKEAAKEA